MSKMRQEFLNLDPSDRLITTDIFLRQEPDEDEEDEEDDNEEEEDDEGNENDNGGYSE